MKTQQKSNQAVDNARERLVPSIYFISRTLVLS